MYYDDWNKTINNILTVIFWFSMLVFLLCMWSCSLNNIRDAVRKEAIDAGVAGWTIDVVTGEKKFQFKKGQ